jgi:hypothetical protein
MKRWYNIRNNRGVLSFGGNFPKGAKLMKIKKILLSFMLFLITGILSMGVSACDNNSEHIHNFSMWSVTTSPSCTVQGSQTRTCSSCGFTEDSSIPAVGHTEIVDSAIESTCTTDGKTEGSHCKDCGTTIIAQSVIKASGHTYDTGEIVENATCVKNGTIKYTCQIPTCQYSYTDDYSLTTYTATEIYNQSIQYVGEIVVYDKHGSELGLGTGFVYSADGKIITNFHVIDGAYAAKITINEKTYSITSILAFDELIDLAVLKVEQNGLVTATVCKNNVQAGETVYAIGSSRGLTNTYSQGIITHADRVLDGVTYVQHDASITNGNSGGPLINIYGEVIGINTWGLTNSQNLNFAVFTRELDNLDYNSPITMTEFYEMQHTENVVLSEWLLNNYNYTSSNYVCYQLVGDWYAYGIVYDTKNDYNFLELVWTFDDGSDLVVTVELSRDEPTYTYFAQYKLGNNVNQTYGIINPTTYTSSTVLTYYSYEGTYWLEDSLMEFYSSAVAKVYEWFSYCLDNHIDDLSLQDFGFTALEYKYNSSAISMLKTSLQISGVYFSDSQWYRVSETNYYEGYSTILSLVYNAEGDSVFSSFSWFGDEGTHYFAYLSLSKSLQGNYYGCSYSEKENGEYVTKNDTHGYLEAGVFTSQTALTYVSFDGLTDYKDSLLSTYTSCLQSVLNYVASYLVNKDLDIALADLGFIFNDPYITQTECNTSAHIYQSPVFTWVEDENGFNVSANFVCQCGNCSEKTTTYVSNTDYTVTKNADETKIAFAFTASVVFEGVTYTDTRYIKYEYQIIALNNSNYKNYIGVGCGVAGYDIYTTISKKNENLTYSNVVVIFKVSLSGKYNINGYDGVYNYHNTFNITNTSLNGSMQYTDIETMVYSASLTYSVSVSGQVSGYIMTAYLVS